MTRALSIAIIGAGMAGMACASRLQAAGHKVEVFDKGRGPGGRMSTRPVDVYGFEIGFDHGAQYFTARDMSFLDQVEAWQDAGVVAPWPAAGADAWVGTPGMNAPIAQMANGLSVQFSRQVETLDREGGCWRLRGTGFDHGGYDAAIVAVPAEQAAPLLIAHSADYTSAAKHTRSAPCWTIMAAFGTALSGVPDVIRSMGSIVWAARNSSKPGRSGVETWIIQASPDWTRANLGKDETYVIRGLLAEFEILTGRPLPLPVFQTAHSWLYARSGAGGQVHLWDETIGLGVCGDWLIGPRVECAWVSGRSLADRIERGE